MKLIDTYQRSLMLIILIISTVVFLANCISGENDKKNGNTAKTTKLPAVKAIKYEDFAGSATCINCHKSICEKYGHTAHYLTTRPASEKYIKGSFQTGKNLFRYDSGRVVVMEKRDSGLYQV